MIQLIKYNSLITCQGGSGWSQIFEHAMFCFAHLNNEHSLVDGVLANVQDDSAKDYGRGMPFPLAMWVCIVCINNNVFIPRRG